MIPRAALLAVLIGLACPADAAARSCADEIGRREAEALVTQCRIVSPATRPPCNVANACGLIREEIERGCTILGNDAPYFCGTTDDDDEEDS